MKIIKLNGTIKVNNEEVNLWLKCSGGLAYNLDNLTRIPFGFLLNGWLYTQGFANVPRLFVELKPGMVDFISSREELDMTPRTKEVIQIVEREIKKHIEEIIMNTEELEDFSRLAGLRFDDFLRIPYVVNRYNQDEPYIEKIKQFKGEGVEGKDVFSQLHYDLVRHDTIIVLAMEDFTKIKKATVNYTFKKGFVDKLYVADKKTAERIKNISEYVADEGQVTVLDFEEVDKERLEKTKARAKEQKKENDYSILRCTYEPCRDVEDLGKMIVTYDRVDELDKNMYTMVLKSSTISSFKVASVITSAYEYDILQDMEGTVQIVHTYNSSVDTIKEIYDTVNQDKLLACGFDSRTTNSKKAQKMNLITGEGDSNFTCRYTSTKLKKELTPELSKDDKLLGLTKRIIDETLYGVNRRNTTFVQNVANLVSYVLFNKVADKVTPNDLDGVHPISCENGTFCEVRDKVFNLRDFICNIPVVLDTDDIKEYMKLIG